MAKNSWLIARAWRLDKPQQPPQDTPLPHMRSAMTNPIDVSEYVTSDTISPLATHINWKLDNIKIVLHPPDA